MKIVDQIFEVVGVVLGFIFAGLVLGAAITAAMVPVWLVLHVWLGAV